jgi:hypothetical protein
MFGAQLNPESPVGTIQSIEHALRALDKGLADEGARFSRCEKMLADYREQLGKPFEHEARLKELLAKQADLNAALDLDKGEQQAAAPAADGNAEGDGGDGISPEDRAPDRARRRPPYEPRRRREYKPPEEAEVDADPEPVVPLGNRNDMTL